MKQLRTELQEAGVFRHHALAGGGKAALLLAGTAVCLAGTILGPLWLGFILIPFASLFATTAAMFGHEGRHRSFSASPRRNAILNYITFPLLTGLGATFWKNKHDVGHHGHP